MRSGNIKDFKKLLNDEEGGKDFLLYFKNEKNAIEKICNSTELKEVEFEIMSIEKEELLKFNINNFVQKLTIIYNHIENIFKNIIEKFPNVSELFMTIAFRGGGYIHKFIIEENENCKINKINIIIREAAFLRGIYIACGPFEKLEKFSLILNKNNKVNLKDSFPIFYDECPIIFTNLKFFEFKVIGFQNKFNDDVTKNIFNNIDNMPNLESFSFHYSIEDSFPDYHNDHYNEDAVKKLLKLKSIKVVFIEIYSKKQYYSKNELKSLYPEINFNKFKIMKLPKV